MKKLAILLACSVMAISAHAEGDIDKGLREAGIVDRNYVFQDMASAKAFFTLVNKELERNYPQALDSEGELYSASLTPTSFNFTLRFYQTFTPTERSLLVREFPNSPEYRRLTQEICRATFDSERFLAANNYRVNVRLLDKDRRLLSSWNVQRSDCR